MEKTKEIFGKVVYSYTREQAIKDGVLVDVSEIGKEAGIKYPVAVTSAVWNECVEVPAGMEAEGQSIDGRLWDVLFMFSYAARRHNGGPELLYRLGVRNQPGHTATVTLKAVIGPGDNGEPVITIMLPNED